jgi:hypothetical protein
LPTEEYRDSFLETAAVKKIMATHVNE